VPLSTVDWPGQLAATVFARGCPWNCPYCHNPHLISGGASGGTSTWSEVLAFLGTRRGLLDAVVFSGGEPTAQAELAVAMGEVRSLGFATGLHTAGQIPDRLAAVLPLADWIGFDVKAPFSEYDRITRTVGSGPRALTSLRMLVSSGTPFEARTTVHPDLLGPADLEQMADELVAEGVRVWALQAYRPDGVRAGELGASAALTIPDSLRGRFETLIIR